MQIGAHFQWRNYLQRTSVAYPPQLILLFKHIVNLIFFFPPGVEISKVSHYSQYTFRVGLVSTLFLTALLSSSPFYTQKHLFCISMVSKFKGQIWETQSRLCFLTRGNIATTTLMFSELLPSLHFTTPCFKICLFF